MDINLLIESSLSPLCPVYFEETTFKDEPAEYILFMRIYGDERNFTNGNPIHNYHLYRVNYFGTKRLRQSRMKSIKTAMKAAGFYLQEDNIPIPREANAKCWGAYSEFAYWEEIQRE